MRVLVAGATGYVGRHAVRAIAGRGHEVVALVRPRASAALEALRAALGPGSIALRPCEPTDPASVERDGLRGERVDAFVSCLASRSGEPRDAWRVDHRATVDLLEAAGTAGARRVVLLSALCVQRPRLAFQEAKLAAEAAVRASGLGWSVVRPTAFFKSLSGQVRAVARGKPFVVFGDGTLTACKPIAEEDLADLLADCLEDPRLADRVLPVGGPGPALTPRAQGELLFELAGRTPRFRHVPPGLLSGAARLLDAAAVLAPGLRAKAELARIGHYYATESMLVWDAAHGRYDADGTPEVGRRTLREHYVRVLREGLGGQELGAHALFDRGASAEARDR